MYIYTVDTTDKINYDRSFEQRKVGCFYNKKKAIEIAKAEFEKVKEIYADEIKKYSNKELYPEDVWDSGALWIEEDDSCGYYCISYGAGDNYESHQVGVEDWPIEDEMSEMDAYDVHQKYKAKYLREDIKAKAEELEINLEGKDMDDIVCRVEHCLMANDGYWDSYWMSIEYVLENN